MCKKLAAPHFIEINVLSQWVQRAKAVIHGSVHFKAVPNTARMVITTGNTMQRP